MFGRFVERSARMTRAGSVTMPITPPTTMNSHQLQAGKPAQAGARVTNATSLETNAAIIPPEKKPMGAMKQPIARVRGQGASVATGVSEPVSILVGHQAFHSQHDIGSLGKDAVLKDRGER